MKRGSIDLAKKLCYDIAGPKDDDDDTSGYYYGSVDIAEILSAEVERLRSIIDKNSQTGISAGVDFENNTWTFEMPDGFTPGAGKYLIIKVLYNDEVNHVE